VIPFGACLSTLLVSCLFAQGPTIRTSVPFVVVPVSVTDARGRFVNDLTASDFVVLDNGQLQPVQVEAPDLVTAPFHLVVLVQTSDISDSALRKIQKVGTLVQDAVVGVNGAAALVTFLGRSLSHDGQVDRKRPEQETSHSKTNWKLVIMKESFTCMKFKCVSTLALASLGFAADVPSKPPLQIVDQIIARVNGDIVSQDELTRFAMEFSKAMQEQGATQAQVQQELTARQKDALRDRIDELLLTQKGKELNINVDSDLSKYMANLQRQSGVTDPEKFHDYIRQQSGRSFEDFQSETKTQFLTREVIGHEVGRHINISDKEVEDYYNAHKQDFVRDEKVFLSEILISTQGKTPAAVLAAEKKAKQIAADASKGQRFSDLARDNSDATTAKEGGVLGGYKKGELTKQIEDAVWNLPKGGVTQPIKLPTGFEVFKVDDHTKAGLAPLSDVKPEIENQLYGPKMQPRVREYLTQLRRQAFLQIKSGYVDTGAAPGQNTAWQDPAQLKPETVTKAEVEQKTRRKRLLWTIPIPGTETTVTGKSSSR